LFTSFPKALGTFRPFFKLLRGTKVQGKNWYSIKN